MTMNLRILLPGRVLLSVLTSKVIAEAQNGSFCLLPRHIDFLAALVPGLLSYIDTDQQECFVAVDEGILIKRGPEVLVSTRQAVPSDDIASLRNTVRKEFQTLDERERSARSAMARLESDLIRRFLEMGERPQ